MRKIYTAIAATVSRISDPIKKKPRNGIKHRCGRDRHYLRVTFKFESAREAAEYMLAVCGPLPEPAEGPNLSIDRIDGRRGYERGNLRCATMQEQLAKV
jgi:hypothetical protein